MAINCNSTRAAVIDATGILQAIDLVDSRELSAGSMRIGRIERKDVWTMCWAKDNPQLLAIMEKTRMYVFRGADPEEPISCYGYLCNFEDLEITGVLLDDIISGSVIGITRCEFAFIAIARQIIARYGRAIGPCWHTRSQAIH